MGKFSSLPPVLFNAFNVSNSLCLLANKSLGLSKLFEKLVNPGLSIKTLNSFNITLAIYFVGDNFLSFVFSVVPTSQSGGIPHFIFPYSKILPKMSIKFIGTASGVDSLNSSNFFIASFISFSLGGGVVDVSPSFCLFFSFSFSFFIVSDNVSIFISKSPIITNQAVSKL